MTRLPADARLVIIADTGFAGPNRVVELIRAALPEKGGSRIIVVERDKRPASEQNDQERLERLKALRQLTRERGVALVVNQRLDLAIASDADGIHLPERGLPLDVVQAIAPHLWLGRSCHDAEGLKRAEEAGADWAFLSPIAPPFSKTTSLPPIGVDAFGLLVSQRCIPVFALGGVNEKLISPLLNAGAQGVAVIGHVLGADDPRRAAAKLLGDC